MTAVDEASALARRAARSEWLERLTRIGLIGYGVTHLLVGWLALQIAFGASGGAGASEEGDQSGAFKTLVAQPAGKWLLLAVTVGLVAMTVWQVLSAAVGHLDERGRSRTFERVASACRAAFYTYLAYKAATVSGGSSGGSSGGGSSGDQQQQTTSTLLASAGGRWLVGLIGLAVAAIGAGLVWYGLVKRFEKHLKTGQMSATMRRSARWLGIIGYVAKGVAYGTVGVLVLLAAVNYDPSRSRGLDQALRTLAAQPAGDAVLVGVAVGIVAYGVFCLVEARHRKV